MAVADVSGNPIAELVSLRGRVAVVTGGAQGLARPVLFAASDMAMFMTGSTLPVEGGIAA